MMRQHKDRCVKRRVFTPPAFPVLVWSRAANRAKHIAAQNPRSDVLDAARRKIIVYSSCARFFAVQQLLKRGGREKPLVYIQTPIPFGFSRLCSGPAANPSRDRLKHGTRNLLIVIS